MLLHLDIKNGSILESPFHYVCLMGDTFDMLTLGKVEPPLVEVFKLDQMPDVCKRSIDHSRLKNGSRGRDCGSHIEKRVRAVNGSRG